MKQVTKSVLGMGAAAVIAAASFTPMLVSAWGDSANGRQTYTLEQINNGDLGDTITFDSITNGAIGDERNFVGALQTSTMQAKNNVWKADEIQVQDGETYTIRLYVHNNSPKGEQAIAENVKAYFSLPTTVSNQQKIVGYLDSSNATPTRIWDEVMLTSDENFYIEFVEGSATYQNNVGTFPLSNDIVVGAQSGTGGALLGYTTMNGQIPGCYQYDGEVHINVVVHKSVTASVEKKVRIKGTKEWSEAVNAQVGDEVEYQIEYVNLLSDTVNDVMIRDILPNNVEYVAGSTVLYNSNHQDGVAISEDTLTTSGLNIGTHAAKANSYLRFTGKVVDNSLACGTNQLVNWANSTVNGAVAAKDDASVIVEKTCEGQPTTPTTPSTSPSAPETPTTIVSTGPGTIVTGAIGAGAMVTTLGYYLASRRQLM